MKENRIDLIHIRDCLHRIQSYKYGVGKKRSHLISTLQTFMPPLPYLQASLIS